MALVLTLLMALALCGASQARAATALGEQFTSPGDAGFAGTVMQHRTGQPNESQYMYVGSDQGVVTGWSTFGTATPRQLVFKVGNIAEVGGLSVAFAAQSEVQTVSGESTHAFPVRLPIFRGQVLGLYSSDGGPGTLRTTADMNDVAVTKAGNVFVEGTFDSGWTAQAKTRLNVAATVEPDGDGDRWGDETQDKCPGRKGDLEGCPPATDVKQKGESAKERMEKIREARGERSKPGAKGVSAPKCKKGFKKVKVTVRRKGKVVRGKNGMPKKKSVCKKIKKKGKGKGKAKGNARR